MITALQTITITKVKPLRGSNIIRWNFDLNGNAFGQVWTFKAKGETHLFHAKTLAGAYEAFPTYAEAETFMRGKM